jgi:hypothetical protein
LFIIDNHVDAVLVQILSALITRRDVAHVAHVSAQRPFDHILGTLARGTLAKAFVLDCIYTPRYTLSSAWCTRFGAGGWEDDHVFPLHQWKGPLRALAREENWSVDIAGLAAIRRFVERYYVIAHIPPALHRALPARTMPERWEFKDFASIWARYEDEPVKKLMNRALVPPRAPDQDSLDFVLWRPVQSA